MASSKNLDELWTLPDSYFEVGWLQSKLANGKQDYRVDKGCPNCEYEGPLPASKAPSDYQPDMSLLAGCTQCGTILLVRPKKEFDADWYDSIVYSR